MYEHLVFDDVEHRPLATFPGMRERTIRISSSGKTFSATGWKIGWALGPAQLITELTAVKQFLTYVSGAPFQPAVARALDEGDAWIAAARRELQGKRDRLADGLRAGRARSGDPAGHLLHDHRRRRRSATRTASRFCRELPRRCGVVAIPHQVFYDRIERGPRRTSAGRSARPTRCWTRGYAAWNGCADGGAERARPRARYHWLAPGVHRIRHATTM